MFVCSQVVFVVLIQGFIALAENINTTGKALGDYNETSTAEVTSEQTLTSTSVPVTITVNISTILASTPTFTDEATTVSETSTGKFTTTGQNTVTKTTKNVAEANLEISTSLASVKSATTSARTESPCSDGGCSTSSASLKLTTGNFDQISSTEETGGQQSPSAIEHSSSDSTSTEPPSPRTQNKVLSSSGASETVTRTTENSDTTTGSESGSTSVKTVSTTDEASAISKLSSKEVLVHYPKDRIHSSLIPSTHLSVFGVLVGVLGAVVILFLIFIIYRRVKDSGKKKMCFNKEANRLDMLHLRRFTINDVKASLGGIPANGDIWHEMNEDSSIVV